MAVFRGGDPIHKSAVLHRGNQEKEEEKFCYEEGVSWCIKRLDIITFLARGGLCPNIATNKKRRGEGTYNKSV